VNGAGNRAGGANEPLIEPGPVMDIKLFKTTGLLTSVVIAATAAAALLAGCGENQSSPSPTDNGYQPTEPKYALANVEAAFNGGDDALLDAALAANFTFYFDPYEIGKRLPNGYKIPESWTRDELLRGMARTWAGTHSAVLDNSWRVIGSPAPGETTYQATAPVTLDVMTDPGNGYLVEGDGDYEFTRADDGRWRLTAWRDFTYECGCVDSHSLGWVFAYYYQ
jgi:hypothetical protein